MDNLIQKIESQYFKNGLYEDIITRLKDKNIDLNKVKRSDIASVDEFHVRGAAISRELAHSINKKGVSVLDVGCGLGGSCRMLADEYNCDTTGIDLSGEYIRTANKLSKLVNLSSKMTFIQGDATELPFENNSFDVAWTQHVQMNVPDKEKFYFEINRVLKPNGYFLFYEILKKEDRELTYPMPWSNKSNLSFVFREEEMHDILTGLGLTKVQCTDQTQAGIDFLNIVIRRFIEFGPPKMGLNILMGETAQSKLMNLLKHLKNGELELKSGIFKK